MQEDSRVVHLAMLTPEGDGGEGGERERIQYLGLLHIGVKGCDL